MQRIECDATLRQRIVDGRGVYSPNTHTTYLESTPTIHGVFTETLGSTEHVQKRNAIPGHITVFIYRINLIQVSLPKVDMGI